MGQNCFIKRVRPWRMEAGLQFTFESRFSDVRVTIGVWQSPRVRYSEGLTRYVHPVWPGLHRKSTHGFPCPRATSAYLKSANETWWWANWVAWSFALKSTLPKHRCFCRCNDVARFPGRIGMGPSSEYKWFLLFTRFFLFSIQVQLEKYCIIIVGVL